MYRILDLCVCVCVCVGVCVCVCVCLVCMNFISAKVLGVSSQCTNISVGEWGQVVVIFDSYSDGVWYNYVHCLLFKAEERRLIGHMKTPRRIEAPSKPLSSLSTALGSIPANCARLSGCL